MNLAGPAVIQAVRLHLGASVADRLQLPSELPDEAIGGHLARAMGIEADLAIDLLAVTLVIPTAGAATLTPDEAAAHPLCDRWVRRTLAEALSFPILSAARMYRAAADTPVASDVSMTITASGRLAGSAQLIFSNRAGESHVIANYGQAEESARSQTTRLAGWALYRIGWDARRLSEGPTSPAEEVVPPEDGGPPRRVIH